MQSNPQPAGARDGRAVREDASAVDAAVRRLRGEILCLSFAPGEPVTERELEAHCGVSRTVVREALARLIHEGLVQRAARGTIVAPFDLGELDEVFHYRTVVEDAAVRLAVVHATAAELDALQAGLDDGLTTFTPEGWMEIGLDFHVRVAALSRNRFLRNAVHEITTRTLRARWLSISARDGVATTYAEHAQILAAIRERDADRAAALVTAHAAAVHRLVVEAIEGSRRYLGRRSIVGL